MPSATTYTFTLNNFADLPQLKDGDKYLHYQHERGPSGTNHLQGFIIFKRPTTYVNARQRFPGAHIEPARGTIEQNIAYCSKEDSRIDGPFCYGELPTKRGTKRARLSDFKDILDNGGRVLDCANHDFEGWTRHHRALDRYVSLIQKPRETKPRVIIFYGATGTGKTLAAVQYANSRNEDFYIKERSKWWDGYNGEQVCIIDEFYGWIPFGILLRLTDRYPVQVEVKGGVRQFTASTIIFTSNKPPQDWYQDKYMDAFFRRVDTIYECFDTVFMKVN